MEAAVEMAGPSGRQEPSHGQILGSGLVVGRVAREAELDVVSRQLADDVAHIEHGVVGTVEFAAMVQCLEIVIAPCRIAPGPVGVDMRNDEPLAVLEERILRIQAVEISSQKEQHRWTHRLIGMATTDQADTHGTTADHEGRDGPAIPGMSDGLAGLGFPWGA